MQEAGPAKSGLQPSCCLLCLYFLREISLTDPVMNHLTFHFCQVQHLYSRAKKGKKCDLFQVQIQKRHLKEAKRCLTGEHRFPFSISMPSSSNDVGPKQGSLGGSP